MTSLAEALAQEREKRRQNAEEETTKREVGRAVLQALAQRLNAEPLAGWSFIPRGDEILVAHSRNGAPSRQHVGTWIVDQEMRLVLEDEATEWITVESYARVVDRAVEITARFIIDVESQSAVRRELLTELPRRL
jgi:hypothetical protein